MNSYHLRNATIVNENRIIEGDLLIEKGRIKGINQSSTIAKDIDCSGSIVLPGLIDDQVHFREPGLTHKADIYHESQAAVAGGVTSFMEMPNTVPATLNKQKLEEKYAIAQKNSCANYSFYFGASNDNIEDVKNLAVGEAAGVKVFMGSSTGNMLVDEPSVLNAIFANAPTLIATHCENSPRIARREAQWRKQYGEEEVLFSMHPTIRDREACIMSSTLAIELAKKHHAPLHVLHITTAEECALFCEGSIDSKLITAEACVHHLTFCSDDYEKLGGLIKCNPAIKEASDRSAIRQALIDNRIDVVATDHAPHTWEEKQGGYFSVPSGLPLLQETLPLLLELYLDGVISIPQIVEKSSHAVAKRFKIKERGYLREGYWGDVAVVRCDDAYVVENDKAYSKCGWSPFHGRTLRSKVQHTLVNGQLAYSNGNIDSTVRGKRLSFGRQR